MFSFSCFFFENENDTYVYEVKLLCCSDVLNQFDITFTQHTYRIAPIRLHDFVSKVLCSRTLSIRSLEWFSSHCFLVQFRCTNKHKRWKCYIFIYQYFPSKVISIFFAIVEEGWALRGGGGFLEYLDLYANEFQQKKNLQMLRITVSSLTLS